MNKSSKCHNQQCGKNGKTPIYYRKENRAYNVAFYVCKYCMTFSGFIESWHKSPRRIMPFFNDMRGMMRMRLVRNVVKKTEVFSIRKDPNQSCIRCNKYDFVKLYLRDRENDIFIFVGYLCKICKTGYFVNTKLLKFHTRNPKGYHNKDGSLPTFYGIPFEEYIGSTHTTTAEDEEVPQFEEVTIRAQAEDIPKLKKLLQKSKIKLEIIR